MEETSVKDADIAAGKHEISRLSSEVTRLCQERDDVRIQFVDVANRNEFVLNELGQCAFDYICSSYGRVQIVFVFRKAAGRFRRMYETKSSINGGDKRKGWRYRCW